ncbi:ATP phosphoribosyltransferase [Candidatus Bathyarchaeota archaeon]|jgi:ATP phosphoribosyltransferase|nr:ATP phosphoribosyltransferase [Candidatus Bathyarchaeota archaeon]MDP6048611.1 ATP phosphoribosyltransferase [Candidatus Bathyarchaeota archaeon]MDP7442809.1 ATP phosphoribosyltransferase [Candidatus Bathyarchaeota archaeon]
MTKVKFAIPKGHLEGDTLKMLERAGYQISDLKRTYRPSINDLGIELKVLRPQEIPTFVNEGVQDIGISGKDWIAENRADVEILLDLEYSRVRLVVAVPKSWTDVNSLSDLLRKKMERGETLRISSEYLNAAKDYIKANPVYREAYGNADPLVVSPWWRVGENEAVAIYLSFGATEAKPPEDADAIIEVVDTGTSLEQNSLKIIEKVMDTSALLIANKRALKDPSKREKIMDILTLIKGAVDGSKKLHVFANVKKTNLEELLEKLPALKRPTISDLSDPEWCAINTIIDKKKFLEILPILRVLSQGIVVHEPRQVLPLEEIMLENSQK